MMKITSIPAPFGSILRLLAVAGLLTASGASAFPPPADAPYMIVNKAAGMAVEIEEAVDENLTNIRLGIPNGGVHQSWYLKPVGFEDDGMYYIASVKKAGRGGRVLDVSGYSLEAGANVQLFRYFGSRNQRWRLSEARDGELTIISVNSGLCLAAHQSVIAGENVRQSACDGSQRQRWRLVPNPGALKPVRIVARHSGKCLDVSNRSRTDGANVQQYSPHDGLNQLWTLFPVTTEGGDTAQAVISVLSGKALDVSGGSLLDHANIQQYPYHGSDNQHWFLRPTSAKGFFEVVSVASGRCLDVKGASTLDEADVQQYECNGGDNQKWRFQAEALPVTDHDG